MTLDAVMRAKRADEIREILEAQALAAAKKHYGDDGERAQINSYAFSWAAGHAARRIAELEQQLEDRLVPLAPPQADPATPL